MCKILFHNTFPGSNHRYSVKWSLYNPIESKYQTYFYLDILGKDQEIQLLFSEMQSEGMVVTPVFNGQYGGVGDYLFWPPGTTQFSDKTKARRIGSEIVSIDEIRAAFEYARHQRPPATPAGQASHTTPRVPGRESSGIFAAFTGIKLPVAREDARESSSQCPTQ
jgi:hypothetical protein